MVYANIKWNDPSATTAKWNANHVTDLLKGSEDIVIRAGGAAYWAGPSVTPVKYGSPKLIFEGSRSHPGASPVARLITINSQPIFRLRGYGTQFLGAGDLWSDQAKPRPRALVEIEGRAGIPTGRHLLQGQTWCQLGLDVAGSHPYAAAIVALGGYYNDAGAFVEEEQHADNVTIRDAIWYGWNRFVRLENQQGVGLKLDRVDANCWHEKRDAVMVDIFRGGNVQVDAYVNHPWHTMFRVQHYSPWCRELRAHFVSDRPVPDVHVDPYQTVFQYTPIDDLVRYWERWDVTATGLINTEPERIAWDKLYRVPAWYDRRGLNVEGLKY